MSKINDGGAAFPRPFSARHEDAIYWPQSGMSLRDWFAGQALAGWLASFPPDTAVKPINAAAFAYEVADAMLAARRALQEKNEALNEGCDASMEMIAQERARAEAAEARLAALTGPAGDMRDYHEGIVAALMSRAEAAETKLTAERAAHAEARKALDALDRMSRGVDWCDQDEQARRWSAARRALEGGE